MSYEATRAAWAFIRSEEGVELSTSERIVLLNLADRHNLKTGRLDPAISTVASDCCLSERTVQYAITTLVNLGVLMRRVGGGHHKHTNRYGLMLEGCSTFTRTGAGGAPVPATGAPQGCNEFTGGVQDVHPNQEVTKKEPAVGHDAAAEGSVVAFRNYRRPRGPEKPEGIELVRADDAMRAVMANLPWKRETS